jgi:hypothetical protein
MTSATDLHIGVHGGEIVVTLPGSIYSVTYCKSPKGPHLFAKSLPTGYDRHARDDIGRVPR